MPACAGDLRLTCRDKDSEPRSRAADKLAKSEGGRREWGEKGHGYGCVRRTARGSGITFLIQYFLSNTLFVSKIMDFI